MKFSDSWGMLTGKTKKSQEFNEMTAANQAQQVATAMAAGGAGDNAQQMFYDNAYANSLANSAGQGGSGSGSRGRARSRSTFRNPGPSEGIFGYEGFLRPKTGNAFQDLNRFTPLGLLAGLINSATTKPVDSGASYTFNTQSGVGPGTSPQQNLAGFTAPKVNTSLLQNPVSTGQPPVIDTPSPLNFTAPNPMGTYMEMSQLDSPMSVPPSQQLGVPMMNDLPLGPQSFFGGAIDAPAGFATADGVVSVEDAAFQEWLGTEGNSKAIQQWEATNPGFARRMFDRSQFLKRGGGVNSEGNM
tara:strand:+ start:786 stop:1685 length:900 start_codon:yes stop_codon:yes gene_type:complete